MAISLGGGLKIGNGEPVDDRLLYETVDAVFLPAAQGGVSNARRYDGLQIYIKSEQRYYRFVGGIARDNFIPDPAVGSGGGGGGDDLVFEELT